ncbi:methylcrotonoyl-CoA carboxylase subunit alpha, mitochondrial [Euwallacea fornicatus]|uniref:methylcrotonoyl-CoA carboxylase subunit alpha, mitochondrial n=1 Tax=Euwallacea fornicatus TaxID=995702 RepID=UPI00338E4EDC
MNFLPTFSLKCPLVPTFSCPVRLKSTIDKILIANRGEIACRIIKTARKLGVQTVAVYSEADRDSLHVTLANEAYEIGPAPAAQSYLVGSKLLNLAKLAKCQAIHPGYGFLSENAEFAEACHGEDVIFIGPPASAIRDMGIKSTSKRIMQQAGVPIIGGYHGEDQSNENLREEARKIGYPIMIKAVKGGGGKGMRIVHREEDFEQALRSARTESQKSFGDSAVLLEKYLEETRHVEVQVFADSHGNAVHLYERDCSVQRRHQKIIEEAPAPGLPSDLRAELGTAAVRAAKAVGYVGAGTVEFILDKKNLAFHFMEMNTRLQVEHPITEMITGIDLVDWQIKIASGEELPVKQEDIPLMGHAFEARIYAENPMAGFLPGAGKLEFLSSPKVNTDVRVETGVREGDEVSVHYDPMIAKLVVWGRDRQESLTKLSAKLLEYNIVGLETNINFLLQLANHPEFQAANVYTDFIKDHQEALLKPYKPVKEDLIMASVVLILEEKSHETHQYNPFVVESNFRLNHLYERKLKFTFQEENFGSIVRFIDSKDNYEISCDDGQTWDSVSASFNLMEHTLNCSINGHRLQTKVFKNQERLAVFGVKGKVEFGIPSSNYNLEDRDSELESSNKAVAPMPGILDKLFVKVGDSVQKGDPLFVLIAMKMEHLVKASKDAKIANVPFKAGESVPKDATIIQFETVS